MESTILIARVIGVYFMVSGIFVITHKKTLMYIVKDLFAHRAISYIVGVILVLGGSTLVLSNKYNSDTLSIFVYVISWTILIKGILYIFAPDWLKSIALNLSSTFLATIGIIISIVGFYLTFLL